MGKVRHEAFLDLEETLAKRLRNGWARYWAPLAGQIQDRIDRRDWDSAHKLAESIDLGPLFERSRTFARTVGMSALLLGASRLSPPRKSKVAARPPKRELDGFLNQTHTMLARNATQALRDMAHAWVAAEEARLLKYDPDQPRAPAGSSEGGQWISVTGTPEFKAWFGDSKVVDATGKPLRVYHGTTEDVDEFKLGVSSNADMDTGVGFFFAGSAGEAGFFTQEPMDLMGSRSDQYSRNAAILPVYLSIKNPKVYETQAEYRADFDEAPYNREGRGEAMFQHLSAQGYDGIIVRDSMLDGEGSGAWYVAFHAEQVKSAFNARPTDDPHLMKGEVVKLDTGADRNQIKINVAGKNYFGLAASIQVSRLSAFGFLLEAAETGVTNYRVDAVLDERTCEVCKYMDGTVFPVEQGMQHAQLIMDTEDPEALKQIAPFYAQTKASLLELATYGTDDLIDMGMLLPPFHPLCRCILTPTDEASDVHPTQVSDRVALASQALYGAGDGARLTRELFGIEEPSEEASRRLGDVVPDITPAEEAVPEWLVGLITESGTAPPVAEEAAGWIQDLVTDWLAQPAADAPPPPLVTPNPFEGTTIPQQYAEPFSPARLRQVAEMRWPWLAGILGWLALGRRDQFEAGETEADLIAEEELAEIERDERNELREERRR